MPYCTIHEMAAAAAGKGLEILGITEHAPAMPGTCHNFYFHNLKGCLQRAARHPAAFGY